MLKKILFLSIFLSSLNINLDASKSNSKNFNEQIQQFLDNLYFSKDKKQQAKIKTLAKRILIKSCIETLLDIFKKKYQGEIKKHFCINTDFIELAKEIDIFEITKIITEQLLIEEIYPIKKDTKLEKILEAFLPTIFSDLASYGYSKTYMDSSKNIDSVLFQTTGKLIAKTIKSNFFQDKNDKYFNETKYAILYPLALLNQTESSVSFSLTKHFIEIQTYLDLKTGIKNIVNELIKIRITSKKLNLGKYLNKKERKKAIVKIVTAIIKPFLNTYTDIYA